MTFSERTSRLVLALGAAFLALTAVVVGAPASAADRSDVVRVAAYADGVRDRIGAPHLTVAVLGRDGSRWEHASGSGPVERDRQVLIGSVSKTMTATLVLQQVAAGRIGLDDGVATRLPDLGLDGVSVEQLLTHTSGYTAADGLAVSERQDSRPGALRRAAADLSRTGTAGTYAYSSANYLVLGLLVEEVTGRSYADVLRTDLLDPLGMTRTTASADGADPEEGHRYVFGRPVPTALGADESGAPYGYVVSTLADLETWAAAQAGARPDVLAPDLLRRLHAPRVEADADRYGYGWRVADGGVVHHTGSVPGAFAHVLVRPADGRAVVVLADVYGEAQAPALAAVAPDVLRLGDGLDVRPTPADRTLLAVPWVAVGLALLGAVVAALALRRPHRLRWRLPLAALALGVVAALWNAPGVLGLGLDSLLVWAPDTGWSVVAGLVTWALAALVLLLRRPDRGREPAQPARWDQSRSSSDHAPSAAT